MNEKTLIQRFAQVYNMAYEDAARLVDAETDEEVLNKISSYITNDIRQKNNIVLNRAARRKLQKKVGKNNIKTITDTSTKLGYIDLIQKLRELNEKKGDEVNENSIEDN